MEHTHEYELLHKDKYIAVFFCECGASKSAPVDSQGRIVFWTSAKEPRQLEADNGTSRGTDVSD